MPKKLGYWQEQHFHQNIKIIMTLLLLQKMQVIVEKGDEV